VSDCREILRTLQRSKDKRQPAASIDWSTLRWECTENKKPRRWACFIDSCIVADIERVKSGSWVWNIPVLTYFGVEPNREYAQQAVEKALKEIS